MKTLKTQASPSKAYAKNKHSNTQFPKRNHTDLVPNPKYNMSENKTRNQISNNHTIKGQAGITQCLQNHCNESQQATQMRVISLSCAQSEVKQAQWEVAACHSWWRQAEQQNRHYSTSTTAQPKQPKSSCGYWAKNVYGFVIAFFKRAHEPMGPWAHGPMGSWAHLNCTLNFLHFLFTPVETL